MEWSNRLLPAATSPSTQEVQKYITEPILALLASRMLLDQGLPEPHHLPTPVNLVPTLVSHTSFILASWVQTVNSCGTRIQSTS